MFLEESFGIIPIRTRLSLGSIVGQEVFLVKHLKAGHWSFPKGHKKDLSESSLDAAVRELTEETGLRLVRILYPDPFVEHYQFSRGAQLVKKKVYYFLGEVEGEAVLQSIEVSEGKWLTVEQALEVLTFPEARAVFQKALGVLHEN